MARKRLYRTRQEQRAANNWAAKRYRERHSDELRERRRAQAGSEEDQRAQARREKQRLEARRKKERGMVQNIEGSPHDQPCGNAQIETVRRIHRKFTLQVKNRAFFVDSIYHTFITPVPYDGYLPASYLDDSSHPLHEMSREISNIQRHMYYYKGPTPEWKEAEELRADIDDVGRWIDDIHCAFLEGGILGLQDAYHLKQLGHTLHM
ncbi:hypothetical protein PQX77_010042 [Marasmius sp. AFHP31]|nr:hypothetical protein PQX77_010042 [Marasmius sp. AFHP31]